METITVFDFVGTLTKKDSFKDFLIYTFGIAKFFQGIVKNIFPLTGYACGLITNHHAKERLFQTFFAGWTEEHFQRICITYSLEKIDGILRSEAKDRMEWHKAQAHRLVMDSASLIDWLTPWGMKNGFYGVIAAE
ncbi:MAG: haloacid dehalogenase-like hydrolase, partial [Syntrophales bacterium LBB04]|nr:haloacid dehalogenase-like hydrolase [Syntrophales bacterium LBB04]